MKITNVKATVTQPEGYRFRWIEDMNPVDIGITFVTITADDGTTGTASTWLPGPPKEVADIVAQFIGPMVLGQDPWDRERIWHQMMSLINYTIAPKAASAIDTALWDLAGRQVEKPVYKLLGAYREKLPAYASTVTYAEVEDYVNIAVECKEQGFQAFKLHAYGTARDIEVCRAVREAVGPEMKLMLDPVNAYDFATAMKVGRALEELNFHWYEAPIRDEDIPGYRRLRQQLSVPIAGAESMMRGVWDYAAYLREEAVDIVRVIGDGMGGITAMRKVGALCETHNRFMEPHSYGATLVQAAHLHYMLSVKNAEFFELPVPAGMLDFGMKDVITMDDEGFVHAPSKPGLGYDVDWDAVSDATIYEVEA